MVPTLGDLVVSPGRLRRGRGGAGGRSRPGSRHPDARSRPAGIGNSQLASADCAGQLGPARGPPRQPGVRQRGGLRGPRCGVRGAASRGRARAPGPGLGARGPRRAARGAGAARALTSPVPGAREPWLVIARQLVEARLLIASGRPDEAMRLAASPEHCAGRRRELPSGSQTSSPRSRPRLCSRRGSRSRRWRWSRRDSWPARRSARCSRRWPAATSATCVAPAPRWPPRPTTCQVPHGRPSSRVGCSRRGWRIEQGQPRPGEPARRESAAGGERRRTCAGR